MLQGSGTITIAQIAADFVGKYNDWGAFQYSGAIGDLYNLNYFRGRPRYVGGAGPGGPNPGNFSGGQINMSDFYSTEGNCNCACDCAWVCDCDCACDCDCWQCS